MINSRRHAAEFSFSIMASFPLRVLSFICSTTQFYSALCDSLSSRTEVLRNQPSIGRPPLAVADDMTVIPASSPPAVAAKTVASHDMPQYMYAKSIDLPGIIDAGSAQSLRKEISRIESQIEVTEI